ncbi:hypothetical protein [Streptomyces sp. BPTC-684]|uniref:hypothetical protein n=1 Tax=Streptomyces sp. BPTC-684 TaxID=3043734 RepID=UPI0024B17236|nr:hypothetical protein [Streptomyces sp. BPTC-684]WHM37549.1 hypothetical protein QIY60_11975 [Streptomyces sp. BPTC-684]
MTGSYGNALMEFTVIRWAEDAVPEMEFVGDGSWPSLNLEQVDELIADFNSHLQSLRAAREHLALLTDPSMYRRSAS